MTDRTEWMRVFANAVGNGVPLEDDVEKVLYLAGIAAHASERTTRR